MNMHTGHGNPFSCANPCRRQQARPRIVCHIHSCISNIAHKLHCTAQLPGGVRCGGQRLPAHGRPPGGTWPGRHTPLWAIDWSSPRGSLLEPELEHSPSTAVRNGISVMGGVRHGITVAGGAPDGGLQSREALLRCEDSPPGATGLAAGGRHWSP